MADDNYEEYIDDSWMLKYLTDTNRWWSGPGEPMDAEQLAYKRGIHDGLNAKGHIEDIAANESEEDTDPNEFSPANLTPDERAIYDQGYDNGHDDGYDDGYNDGYADGLVAVSEAIDDLQSQEVFDVFATKEDFERAAEFQEEVDKESGI